LPVGADEVAWGVTELLERVEQNLQNRKLLQPGQVVLMAVSGGLDSMALLHLLHRLAGRHAWRLTVAHFNHRLRGRSSDADERLVRRIAARLKLPVVVERAEVKAFAKKSKLSVEMAARKLRHEFLSRAARKRKIRVVALAHHADDQVELFFLRLLRGAGGEGLAGMKWHSPSPADSNITLVRPLLDVRREELNQWVRENQIPFREDATNFSTDFLRNRIRHELLPLLRNKYQPGLNRTVQRVMEIAGAESEAVSETARRWAAGGRPESVKSRSAKDHFETLLPAVQRKILQRQLIGLGVPVDFELIEQLRESTDRFVSVGSGLAVAREATGRVNLHAEPPVEFDPQETCVALAGRAGKVRFAGMRLAWRREAAAGLVRPRRQKGGEFFDADRVGSRIILRHWRPGDRFQPIGMKSAVKLQDLFTNGKIPRARRRELIVATAADGRIFWVEQLRIGEPFKLTSRTRRHLIWRWQRPVPGETC